LGRAVDVVGGCGCKVREGILSRMITSAGVIRTNRIQVDDINRHAL
jgi:hypothetical protein